MEMLGYLIVHIIFAVLSACFGELAAIAILVGLFVGLIVVARIISWCRRSLFSPASASADVLLDGSAIIELTGQSEQPLVAFEHIYDREAQRVAIFSRTAHRLHSPRYCWIARDTHELVRASLSAAGIRTATAESETSGLWYVIHTDDHDPPIVWASNVKETCALMESQGCWVIRTGRRRRAIEKSAIVAVEAWASCTWLRHEVRLHVQTRAGIEVIRVARKLEGRALADGFYDGLDFMCDSDWALRLGHQLAEHLALPLIRSGELKD
jgi:hypothetical protein